MVLIKILIYLFFVCLLLIDLLFCLIFNINNKAKNFLQTSNLVIILSCNK